MQIFADIPSGTLRLAFPERGSTRAFFLEAIRQQAFLAPLPEAPQPFSTFEVRATDPEAFDLSFRAMILQVFPQPGGGFQVAFQFGEGDPGLQARLDLQLEARPAGPGEPAAGPVPGGKDATEADGEQGREAGREAEGEEGEAREGGEARERGDAIESSGSAPIYRIRQMDLPQRLQLALKADRAEREILSRDAVPQVLLNLLANPRLEAENVLAIVKSTAANGDILQRVSGDRRWMLSAQIRTAMVRNPRTPTLIAVRLLETLPLGELRDLAKMGSAREELRLAALKLYLKVGSR